MYNFAVAFYSRTGTTRDVVQRMADRLDCPLIDIADVVSRAGFWGDIRCVFDNLFWRRVPYRASGPDVADCNTLVVMAPVWIGHLAAPMRAFLEDHRAFQGNLAVMAARGGYLSAEDIAMAAGR
ncbi:hypothetical protein [Cupriavidus sp. L7L]|uniref:flavodoxin family protein n=1 Tax=Cupriavidus sp. L7L TaxID=2546443 RepID=UPI001056682F|nr:hypothetical protein [Cupriavidus sp. L7L]TDF67217.1 hypothetical protein E1J61_02640 [Cupriavidus sp. L7L]